MISTNSYEMQKTSMTQQKKPSNTNNQPHRHNNGKEPSRSSSVSSIITAAPTTTSESDFTVIWHNLTYKVDSRPWYTKLSERFCTTNSASSSNQLSISEDGRCFSSHSSNNGSKQLVSSSKERIILNQVCGFARSRQLTAIMGPSGAGKSSLLHCLFQNRTAGTSGRILVDSRSKSKLKVCFIPQSDHLNEWLTVREDLMFVSRLKLAKVNSLFNNESNTDFSTMSTRSNKLTDDDSNKSSGIHILNNNNDKLKHSNSNDNINKNSSYVRQIGNECNTSLIDHEANAIRVAELLGLTNCLDVTIKNISGGQKKRLSIARELMSKPDILILDEPTTGLDSLTCYKTVMVLRDLAHLSQNPMAVVVTIHQPQKEVFNLFDKAYFLSNTGRVIYEDNPKCAIETINKIANVQLPQPNYNPASFLIELASEEQLANCVDRLAKHQTNKFYDNYDLTHLKRLMKTKQGNLNIPNWNFCALDQRDSLYSDSSNGAAVIQKQQTNNIHRMTVIRQHSNNNSNNSSSETTIDLSTNVKQQTEANNQQQSSNPSQSNDPNTNYYHKGDHYYISYQLSNCLSSHSNNLLQSFRHIFILTHRSWLSVIRNPAFTKSRLIFHIVLPMFMLLIFGTTSGSPNNCPKLDAQLDLQDLTKSIKDGSIAKNFEETRLSVENVSFFFILMYGFGINIISCTASFYPLTMRMYKKETINGLYSPAPYFIGQMLAELPLEILLPSISVILSYSLTGQISSFLGWRMFAIAYIVFLVSYCIHSLGLLCGSIFINNVSIAVLSGQIILFPWILLSGFLIRSSRMSDWMVKAAYLSPFKLGLSAITAARYGFDVCDCDDDMLPEEGELVKFSGMTPQLKNVISYLFPKNETNSIIMTNGTLQSEPELDITEVLDKLSQSFIKAQTFALDIKSCDDVQPNIMHVINVKNSDIFISVVFLILIIAAFKLVTFSIMKSFPYRMT